MLVLRLHTAAAHSSRAQPAGHPPYCSRKSALPSSPCCSASAGWQNSRGCDSHSLRTSARLKPSGAERSHSTTPATMAGGAASRPGSAASAAAHSPWLIPSSFWISRCCAALLRWGSCGAGCCEEACCTAAGSAASAGAGAAACCGAAAAGRGTMLARMAAGSESQSSQMSAGDRPTAWLSSQMRCTNAAGWVSRSRALETRAECISASTCGAGAGRQPQVKRCKRTHSRCAREAARPGADMPAAQLLKRHTGPSAAHLRQGQCQP